MAGLWLGGSGDVLGQTFNEDFVYNNDVALTENGWTAHSSGGTNVIKVQNNGLSYLNLIGSDVGRAVQLNSTGEDISKSLGASFTSGALYTSFLVNFSAVQTAGDYFLHLGPATLGSNFVPRVFAKSATGGLVLGASISSTSPSYGTEVLELNRTYLVVVKHSFVSGSSNDVVQVFVNPALNASEPATAYISATGGTDPANIGTIALRQGSASNAPTLLVDAIKVGATWNQVTAGSQTDDTAPTLSTTTPATGATGVDTKIDLILNFNEPIVAGTGEVTFNWNGGSMTKSTKDQGNETSGNRAILRDITLAPNTVYTITVANNAFKDLAGNFFGGVTGNSWTFTTFNPVAPSISAAVSSLTFPLTGMNSFSPVQSYEIDAWNLTESITISVTGPYQIAKGENAAQGIFGTTPISFTQAEADGGEKVFVRFAPTATSENTGTITHSSAGAQNVTVALTGSSYNPYVQDFNDPAFLTKSGWSQYSVSGAQVWASTNFGQTCLTGCNASTPDKAAQINGFVNGANNVNEDWLISPALDLASFTNYPVLQFASISAFAGNQLKLMYSTNYTGSGNPQVATWTEVPNVFPASNSSIWTISPNIELPKQANVYVAFVYTSTATASSRWTIDNFKVEDKAAYYNLPIASLNFGEVVSGNTSAPQMFTFNAKGNGNITVTAPAGFKLKASGDTYAQSIVVQEADALQGQTISVVFAPTTKEMLITGKISFAGSSLTEEGITLIGNSLPKSETFDIAAYNMQFFGNGTQIEGSFGPKNRTLQIENAAEVFKKMNMDIVGVEEISDESALDEMIAKLPGTYAKSISPVYSYSIKPNTSTDPFPAQKIGFIYNTATVQPVSFRVMFENLYRDAVAKKTTLINDSFWSSGRLPYLGIFDVTINGKTQRLHVIDVHAKSGGQPDDYDRRKVDIQVLTDSLNAHYGNANIVILGDYNDDIAKSIRTGYPSTYQSMIEDAARYKALTYDLSAAGASTFPSSNSFLDHIIISNELIDDYVASSITIEDPRTYVTNYSSTTSDHLPISARFAFTSSTPLVTFAQANQTKAEGAGKATITLNVAEAVASEQTIKVKVSGNGSASAGDYTLSPAATNDVVTLTLPANATSVSFDINITDDAEVELDETLDLEIVEVGNLLTIGTLKTAGLKITDNDKATVSFVAASASKQERLGGQTVELSMNKPSPVSQTITLTVTNGAGVAYTTDYTTTPAVNNNAISLTVPAGQTTASFILTPVNDLVIEENETISFEITAVGSHQEIGTAKTFVYTIENDDTPLGVADALAGNFGVSPNPTSGAATLQLPASLGKQNNLTLQVYSVRGEMILQAVGSELTLNNQLSRKLRTAAAGMYVVKVQTGGQTYQTRIVKN